MKTPRRLLRAIALASYHAAHVLAIGIGSMSSAVRTTGAQAPGAVAFEPYVLRTYDGRQHEIELGKLAVPESHGRRDGVTVTVAFLRLRSSRATPGSPIVFLMGGPGIAASVMAPIPPYWELFDALRAWGDVILLDQRGLGLSSPKVDCPPLVQPLDTAFLTTQAAFIAAYRGVLANCAAYWRGKGVDPRAFTDAAIADDIDDIRRALGVPRISVLGFSYGTRLAMTFARRHPDRLDRIALQGPTDADLEYHVSVVYDSLLARVTRFAAADSVTAPFAQNLSTRVHGLLDRADRQAIAVRIRRAGGDSVLVPVGREGLQALLEGHITDSRIPALVATIERGDLAILTRLVEGLYNDFSAGAGTLMARGLTCSAGPSPVRRAAVDALASRSMFGRAFDNFASDADFCAALGGSATPPEVPPRRRLASHALILIGELDDRTPVGNDEVLATEFQQSVRIVVANGGHELLPDRAVRETVVDFFAGRDVRGRMLRQDPPRFLSIEAAKQPPRRPDQ